MSLRLRLLGGARLEQEGEAVKGRATHRRRLALLALLAVAHPRGLTRERIVAYLWPETDSADARRLLSEAVYVIRKELGEGIIVATGDELALDAAVCGSDVADFLAASAAGDHVRAASLYGGAFLDGWYVEGAPDFDEWIDRERTRLAAAYVASLEKLATRAEGAGDHNSAVAYWRALTHADPLSSRIAVGHARALAAHGERAAALQALAAHEARLRADGFPVDREVPAAVEALRREAEVQAEDDTPTHSSDEDGAHATGAVEPGAEAASIGDAGSARSPHAARSVAAQPSTGQSRAWLSRGWLGGVAVAVLLLAFAAVRLPGRADADDATDETLAAALDPNRVAVLYFDDHSPGGGQEHLAYGLTESLIRELGEGDGLDVVSRHGVKAYRDQPVGLDSIARALRAGTVIEGSVQRSEDRVRVSVQLVDAGRDAGIGARVVERPVGELFALQDDLAREVAVLLRRRLGETVTLRQASQETTVAAALELFMRAEVARDAAARTARSGDARDERDARRMLAEADSMLAQVERLDPAWARPAASRAEVQLELARLVVADARVAHLRQAVAHADRALQRDSTLADALEVRGTARYRLVFAGAVTVGRDREIAAAEADLRAAVRHDPRLASAWGVLAQLLRYNGATGEALVAAEQGLRADAYHSATASILDQLYRAAMAAGDLAESQARCAQGRRDHPRDWRFVECGLTLLLFNPELPQDPATAWGLVAELERIDPPSLAGHNGRLFSPVYRRLAAATVSARAGDAGRARQELAWARQQVAGDSIREVDLLYNEAHLLLALGDREGARRALERYVGLRPSFREFVVRERVLGALVPPGTVER